MSGRQFLIVVTITFVTVTLWVISDILHSRSQVTIPTETKRLIEPVDPNFNLQIIQDLR